MARQLTNKVRATLPSWQTKMAWLARHIAGYYGNKKSCQCQACLWLLSKNFWKYSPRGEARRAESLRPTGPNWRPAGIAGGGFWAGAASDTLPTSLGVWESAVSSSGAWGAPPPTSNSVYFSLKIWQLVTTLILQWFSWKQVYRKRYENRRLPNPKLHEENKKTRSVECGYLCHYRNSMKNCSSPQNFTEIGQARSAELWSKKRCLKWQPSAILNLKKNHIWSSACHLIEFQICCSKFLY